MSVLEYIVLGSSLCSSVAMMRMWADVNRELPKEKRIGLIGNQLRMWREHLRIFPDSGLRRFAMVAVVTFATSAVLLEIKKSNETQEPMRLTRGSS